MRKRNAVLMLITAIAIVVFFAGGKWAQQMKVALPGRLGEENAWIPATPSEQRLFEYIKAVQEGDFKRTFEMTQWMQDRVEHIRHNSESRSAERAIDAFYREEAERFFAPTGGATLTGEGVQDAHLLPEGAIVGVVEVKEGLSRPVLNDGGTVDMIVVEIEYPAFVRPPSSGDDTHIERLRAEFYVSSDGMILKASIRGNARVDFQSIKYRRSTYSEIRRDRERKSR